MLIFLLSLSFLIAGIILCILHFKLTEKDCFGCRDATVKLILSIIFTTTGGVMLFISLIWIIFNQSSVHCKNLRIELNKKIDSLNATYSIISKREDNSIVEIVNYNSLVKDYKTQIESAKMWRSSLWLNWFECRAYDNFTGDEVQYFMEG